MKCVTYSLAAAAILAGMQAAHATIMLEDFSGISATGSFGSTGNNSATLPTPAGTPAVAVGYNGIGGYTIGGGLATVSTSTGNSSFTLYFGAYASNGSGNYSVNSASIMNANWTSLTGIKINITNNTGLSNLAVDLIDMMSLDSNLYLTGDSTGTTWNAISGTGSFIVPISGLYTSYGSGANMADVDTLSIRFNIWPTVSGTTGSFTIDSIELVGVTAAPVPEPAAVSILAMGIGALLLRRKKA